MEYWINEILQWIAIAYLFWAVNNIASAVQTILNKLLN